MYFSNYNIFFTSDYKYIEHKYFLYLRKLEYNLYPNLYLEYNSSLQNFKWYVMSGNIVELQEAMKALGRSSTLDATTSDGPGFWYWFFWDKKETIQSYGQISTIFTHFLCLFLKRNKKGEMVHQNDLFLNVGLSGRQSLLAA